MSALSSESSVVLKLSKISSYLTSFQVDVPNFKSSPRSAHLVAAGKSPCAGPASPLRAQDVECPPPPPAAAQATAPAGGGGAALPAPFACSRNSISTYYDETHELFTDESFKSLGRRIKTYAENRWMLPTDVLSVYICARRGWYLVAPDVLRCSDCHELLSLVLPSPAALQSYERALRLLQERVHTRHLATCRWCRSPALLSWCRPPPLLEPAALYAVVQLVHDLAAAAMCSEQPYMADGGRHLLDKMGLQDSTLDAVLGLGHSAAQRTALLLLLCGWKRTSVPAALRCELCKRRIGLWCFRSVEEHEKFLCSNSGSRDSASTASSLGGAGAAEDIADGDASADDAPTVTNTDSAPPAVDSQPNEGSSAIVANTDGPTAVDSTVVDSALGMPSVQSRLSPGGGDPSGAQSDTAPEHTQKNFDQEYPKIDQSEFKEDTNVLPVSVPSTEDTAAIASAVDESVTAVAASDCSDGVISSTSVTCAAQVDNGSESVPVAKTDIENISDIAPDKCKIMGENSQVEEVNTNASGEPSGGTASTAGLDCSQTKSPATEAADVDSTVSEDAAPTPDVCPAASCEAAAAAASSGSQAKRKRQELDDESGDNLESAECKNDPKKSKVSLEESSAFGNRLPEVTTSKAPPPRPVLCPLSQHHAWCGWVTPARQHALPGDALAAEDQHEEGYRALSRQLVLTLQRAAAKRWTETEKYSTCVQGVRSVRALVTSWLHEHHTADPAPSSP